MIISILTALTLSLSLSIILLSLRKYFNDIGIDSHIGAQKIHKGKALRVGSIPIFLSFFIVTYYFSIDNKFHLILFISLLPVILIGLLEDITLIVSVFIRLLAIIISVSILVILTNSFLLKTNLSYIDYLLNIHFISLVITVLGISIASNSFNFIDGLNGLTSGLSIVYLLVLYNICLETNEIELANLLIVLAFSVIGFWIVNIFTGIIFLGDAGAYSLGIVIGWSGVYITAYNPEISPWIIFFIIIYPASEFSLSFIRRIFNKKNPTVADDMHLHTTIYKLLFLKFNKAAPKLLNSICGLVLTLYGSIPSIVIIFIGDKMRLIIYCLILYIISFALIYDWCKRKLKNHKNT